MTTKYKFTHTGIYSGCDNRTTDKEYKIYLRETKLFWITKKGTKFKKSNGYQPYEQWPVYKLDLNSIKKMTSPV